MPIGLVGRKAGMTRIFTDEGASVPVTVIEVPSRTASPRSRRRDDGYRAVQVTTGERRAGASRKPPAGHFAKAGVEAGRGLWEFRSTRARAKICRAGGEIGVDQFRGRPEGRRHRHHHRQGLRGRGQAPQLPHPGRTHGNSLAHRAPGSIGQNQTPGRVFKGKKMAGHMGNVRRTTPEPGSGSGRRGTQPAAGQGRRARPEGRRRDHPPGRQGAR